MANNGRFPIMSIGYVIDRVLTYGLRLIIVAGLGFVWKVGSEIRDGLIKFNELAPQMVTEKKLDEKITKVSNDLKTEFQEKIKKGTIITGPNRKP